MELACTEERPARDRQSRAEQTLRERLHLSRVRSKRRGPVGGNSSVDPRQRVPSEQPEVMGSRHSGETSGGGWSLEMGTCRDSCRGGGLEQEAPMC